MRLLIVGNSHATALVASKAANRYDRWAGIDVDFYVIPGPFAPLLIERDGRFFPVRETIMLRSTIADVQAAGLDVRPYDVILFSGLGLPAGRNRHLESGVHPLGAAHLIGWRKPDAGPQPLVSEQCMLDVVKDRVAMSGSYGFVRDAARLFEGPIYVQTVANPNVKVLDDPDWLLKAQLGDNLTAALTQFADLKERAIAELLSGLPGRVILLKHPQRMEAQPGFISATFRRRGDPLWHTNFRHGDLVLYEVLRQQLRSQRVRQPRRETAAAS